MLKQNMINTLTCGISVGDLWSSNDTGKSIVFGGIDKAKFTGPLKTYGIQNSEIMNRIGFVGINYIDELGVAAPLGEDLFTNTTKSSYLYLGIPPDWYDVLIGTDPYGGVTLGDPFFRGAYVVLDYTHRQISLASAVYNQSQEIIEVGMNGSSVSELGLHTVVDEDEAVNGDLGSGDLGSGDLGSGTLGVLDSDEVAIPSPKPPIGPIIGGSVGGTAFLTILVVAWVVIRRRRKLEDIPVLPDTILPPFMLHSDCSPAELGVGEPKLELETEGSGSSTDCVTSSPV
ncbi:hypothetical protein ABW19_dt0200198 [Dactylella cylindrospora]|nr:hypothetical protein ABW19_dt0200198 [Dactylella cylindrospora]